ncbi:MAG: hypothetical protein ACI8PD_000024 [Nitrospinales bacterium]|jgi:hypothetical protein
MGVLKLPLLLGVVGYVGNAKKSHPLAIDKLTVRVLILSFKLRVDNLPGS